MNRSPGPTSRLSNVTPVTANELLAAPPVARAISCEVQSALMPRTPLNRSCRAKSSHAGANIPRLRSGRTETGASRRALASDFGVIERQDPVADDLASLVPLPGKQHDIPFARNLERSCDRFLAPRH